MAENLPVIIDNRGDNTVVNALRRLLPNLQEGVFEVGVFSAALTEAMNGRK